MTPLRRSDGQGVRDGAARGILVAVHRGHLEVQKALDELTRSHLGPRQLSVVGADYHTRENVYGYYSSGRRFEAWGSFGAFWSGVWATLTDEGFFFIPGLGPLLMAGPVVGWLVTALETGVMEHGLSPLGAALVANGLPVERMGEYESAVRDNEFLLILSGSLAAMAEARSLVESTGARVEVYPLQTEPRDGGRGTGPHRVNG
jgi:hypothetical protein